jgi:hypothetical protein
VGVLILGIEMSQTAIQGIGALTVFAVAFGLYFLPYLNAWSRKHRRAGAIFWLNFFLGWTVLGWIAAVFWSATNNVAKPRTIGTLAAR